MPLPHNCSAEQRTLRRKRDTKWQKAMGYTTDAIPHGSHRLPCFLLGIYKLSEFLAVYLRPLIQHSFDSGNTGFLLRS